MHLNLILVASINKPEPLWPLERLGLQLHLPARHHNPAVDGKPSPPPTPPLPELGNRIFDFGTGHKSHIVLLDVATIDPPAQHHKKQPLR